MVIFAVVPGPMFSCSEMIWSLSSVRISSSLGEVPLLVTVKVITPEGNEVLENWHESSVMVTVISWGPPEPEAPDVEFLGLSVQAARVTAAAARGNKVSTLRRLRFGICIPSVIVGGSVMKVTPGWGDGTAGPGRWIAGRESVVDGFGFVGLTRQRPWLPVGASDLGSGW